MHGRVAIVELLLLIKMNINTQDIDSDYPRSNGARNGHLTMMDLLLEAGAEVIGSEPGPCWDCLEAKERVEECARDALRRAREKGHEDVVILIFKNAAERESANEDPIASKCRWQKKRVGGHGWRYLMQMLPITWRK